VFISVFLLTNWSWFLVFHFTKNLKYGVMVSIINVKLCSALSWSISKALRHGPCVTMGSHSFTCHPHKLYRTLLPSRKVSPLFGWYSLRLSTNGWPGWVDLGGWLHIDINVPHRELNQDTIGNQVRYCVCDKICQNRGRCLQSSCSNKKAYFLPCLVTADGGDACLDYYTPDMIGIKVDCEVLGELIRSV